MKLKLLKATEFRGKKYKKGASVDVPDGVANKMILNSLAQKA